MRVFVFCMSVLFVACHEDCVPEYTRCNGEVVEVCNTKGDWEESADCGEISEGIPLDFECGEGVDGDYECLLVGGYDLDAGLDAGF